MLIDFVYSNIVHTKLEHRVAAMLIFDAILYAGKREEIE